MKSTSTIKRHLRRLRKEVIESGDPVASRIAYAMETAIRWATEDTVGWPSLADQAWADTKFLKQELLEERTKGK